MITTEAWVLYPGPEQGGSALSSNEFRLESFSFPSLEDDELLVAPLYGCWETNMSHALARHPIDVCKFRGDRKVVLGNASVLRVLAAGPSVRGIREGDVGVLFGGHTIDRFGYTVTAHGYDAPGSIGVLAKRTKIPARNFLPVPENSGFSNPQWAAFSVRYLTAWSNWKVAHGAYRLQVSESEDPAPFVLGWGGGSTLATLDLARRQGCRTAMLASSDARLEMLRGMGIMGVDRRQFGPIDFDDARYQADAAYRAAYRAAERALLDFVHDWTRGQGVAVFVDYIGAPVIRATLKALARQGVVTTAGWLLGMHTPMTRAIECIQRHIHVYTHYAKHGECADAIAYAVREAWMPEVGETYAWEDIPKLATSAAEGTISSYFPVYEINPD
jgi:NADPH:quinone reductase-like Zn-dependent oxidoreductase